VKKGKKEEPPVQVTFTHPSTQPARNRVAANHYRMLWNGWETRIQGFPVGSFRSAGMCSGSHCENHA